MNKKEATVTITFRTTEQKANGLVRLSHTSGKTQVALMNEALDLLFKTPGGKK